MSKPPPPPFTPITGSSPLRAEVRNMSKPDWEFWLNIRAVKVWQACLLSLDIDPDNMKGSPTGWMAGLSGPPIFVDSSFPSQAVKDTYRKRLTILASHIGDKTHFRLHSIIMGEPTRCEIYLRDFAKWVVHVMHWKDIPSELAALAQTPPEAAPVKQESPASAIAAARPATSPAPRTFTPLKGTRSNILDGVIQAARSAAHDPDNYQQVWAELVRMAESSNRPAPLRGYVEGEGLKYQDESKIKFLTKNALRGRFYRRTQK